MSNYLLEIGAEELPANFLEEGEAHLQEATVQALQAENLTFKATRTYSTPRRLTIVVEDLAREQTTVHKKVKGPPVKSSFDDKGAPLPAAIGFAGKNQLTIEQLERETIGGTEYLIANTTTKGLPAEKVLPEVVPKIIKKLSGERMMRWGSGDLKFSRPIRWIVSLLDSEVVPFKIESLEAGRVSQGHRVLSSGAVEIKNADDYVAALEKAGVLVERNARRELIKKQVAEAAHGLNGEPRKMSDSLLEEVVNITEAPCAIVGDFAPEYLELPPFLIETIMVHHQRYFPVQEKSTSHTNGKKPALLPHFIAVSNNNLAPAAKHIKQGNERVLKARLADGKFFYFDDQKTRLCDRLPALGQLTFQEGLGSYKDKIVRLKRCAQILPPHLLSQAEALLLSQAIELCKADLVSNLVRELPELQGFVGSCYAEQEGAPSEVVRAIASHYSPRSPEDSPPHDKIGRLVALIDKLDSLAGGFVMGRKPTGSSDPYALRRQAQGVIDIAAHAELAIDLSAIVGELIDLIVSDVKNTKLSASEANSELAEFLLQRLRTKLHESGLAREVVEAVTASGDALMSVPNTIERCQALSEFAESKAGVEILRACVRVSNIIGDEEAGSIDSIALSEQSEMALLEGFKKSILSRWPDLEKQGAALETKTDYNEYLKSFEPLVPLINTFFDELMVNDPDPVKKNNRRSLLANISKKLKKVGDFSKLLPLLN